MNQIPSDPPPTTTCLVPSLGYCPCDNRPEPPSSAEAEPTSTRPDGDEMRAAKYADLIRERDHAREERAYWRRIAETVGLPCHLVAVPVRTLSDIAERAERAEAELSAALAALRDARAMIRMPTDQRTDAAYGAPRSTQS